MARFASVGRDLIRRLALALRNGNRLWNRIISPHRNLYTPIQASSNGVGLFRNSNIPKGTQLFVGDVCHTVRIPVSDVEKIADPGVQRIRGVIPIIDNVLLLRGISTK